MVLARSVHLLLSHREIGHVRPINAIKEKSSRKMERVSIVLLILERLPMVKSAMRIAAISVRGYSKMALVSNAPATTKFQTIRSIAFRTDALVCRLS